MTGRSQKKRKEFGPRTFKFINKQTTKQASNKTSKQQAHPQ